MEAGMTGDIFAKYHQQVTDRFSRNLYLMPGDMPYNSCTSTENNYRTGKFTTKYMYKMFLAIFQPILNCF